MDDKHARKLRSVGIAALPVVALFLGMICHAARAASAKSSVVPAQVALGERLFLETRFSEPFFARQRGGDGTLNPATANNPSIRTSDSPRPKAVSCRTCHLVDEFRNAHPGGVRSYTDFAQRSPIPSREDGLSTTARNSPTLVDATLPRAGPMLLHFDGEFASGDELVRGTLTGRNFGWLATEQAVAIAHIAAVIRDDDGEGDLARLYGGIPYKVALAGTAPSLPAEFRLPVKFRLDPARSTDRQILNAIARLIAAYMDSLRFSRDASGNYSGSPYDLFLARNRLPKRPAPDETELAYARRLRALVGQLGTPHYVSNLDGRFRFHLQDFQFGPRELAGLKIFLAESASPTGSAEPAGNCISCHTPPHFTDFSFHNTGVSQIEYDTMHGDGAFERLIIPGLKERNAAPDRFLPASPAHPLAAAVWRSGPATDRPGLADLGVWNVLGNPDLPSPQRSLREILCTHAALPAARCSAATLLPLTIGMFKTPTLRDLGQSGPYLHSGAMAGIEDVLRFYQQASELARRGRLRNADPQISKIQFGPSNVLALAAFLKSLNEDYKEVRGVSNLAFRRLLWYGPLAPGTSGLTEALTKARIDLIAVSSSQDALTQLTTQRFDWVVIDVRDNAFRDDSALNQAVRRIRGTHLEIPIIVYCDDGAQPRLAKGAGRIGLTIVASPGVLLSSLIAMRPDD